MSPPWFATNGPVRPPRFRFCDNAVPQRAVEKSGTSPMIAQKESSFKPTFADLHLSPPLLKVLSEIGYETPSPIQAAAIPPILEGNDLIGQAQTGTGKTAAFALPLLERIEPTSKNVQVLVLTPTRELSIQVAEAFHTYARHIPDFHVVPIYGGQGMEIQLRQLKRRVHVVVGTPGRVMDHLRRGTLVLRSVSTLVLDEADEMLRMGFIEDVEWILEQAPADCQKVLFSATMPDPIRRVAHRHLHEAKEIRIKSEKATVASIRQYYWTVSGNKLDVLTRALEAQEMDAALIFVRTRTETTELAEKLEARGYACAALSGEITQNNRERIVKGLKDGKLDIVIATDVAARGIDVQRITHVINYDIPGDVESYVHRIGRTGRAGREGCAILLVSPREMGMLRVIERATRQPMERLKLPDRREVTDLRIARFTSKLMEVIEGQDLEPFHEIAESIVREKGIEPGALTAALLYLAQKDQPLHANFKEEPPAREWEDRGGHGDRSFRPRGQGRSRPPIGPNSASGKPGRGGKKASRKRPGIRA